MSIRTHECSEPPLAWVAVAILLVLAFVILVLVTDGGDLNPFGNAAPAVQPGTEIGAASQPM